MRVLMVAGGTAGHVNPALAIAEGILEKWPDTKIHFAGRMRGMEYGLVKKVGYPFHNIEVRGFQRNLAPRSILRNLAALWYLALSGHAARAMLKKLKPDLVIGTGGYVSGPVVREAAKKGIKTAIHEQNAYPGITNRLLARSVDLVLAPGEGAVERLGFPEKTVVTGNPVAKSLFAQDREKIREKLGANGRVVLLSFGGSLGAMRLNRMIAELASWHLKNRDFLHIHATGSIEIENFTSLTQTWGIANHKNFVIREYIDNMPEMLAAADLVICRAGALTLAELAAAGRASVLIPSPNVAENHQYYNAMEMGNAGAAEVLEEKRLTGELLIETVDRLTEHPDKLAGMGRAARTLARPEAVHQIIGQLRKFEAILPDESLPEERLEPGR